jgi:predicted secreted protein
MNATKYLVLSFLSILLVCACPAIASIVTFTEEDSGNTVHVNQGDTIILPLVENPSTGFRWFMDATRGLILKSDEYEPSGSGLIGAAGTRTWTYTVTVSGILSISGIYKQGWMPPTGNEDVFTLTLISGERNYMNSRTPSWWDSVPKFTRISTTPQKLQGIYQKFPNRFF